jgi:hypothetical protein
MARCHTYWPGIHSTRLSARQRASRRARTCHPGAHRSAASALTWFLNSVRSDTRVKEGAQGSCRRTSGISAGHSSSKRKTRKYVDLTVGRWLL